MASRNDITGDTIQTKTVSQKYRDNWDLIFGKKEEEETEEETEEDCSDELQRR